MRQNQRRVASESHRGQVRHWVWRGLALLVLSCLAVPVFAVPSPAGTQGFRIVVNLANTEASLSSKFVEDCFLKKIGSWEDGLPLLPVDQKATAETRRAFSTGVLRRSVAAVRMYWQQRVFAGRGIPPPELDGDGEVLHYVSSNRGGIGYVSEAAKLDGVKTITLR